LEISAALQPTEEVVSPDNELQKSTGKTKKLY
jgi:hypothetical protein